ncbi:MAG: FAD-linked oxidase C-terminal domain-containing protein [Sphingobium sp.]|uniref:FAD-binding oxidoreductase n=1 Tax=Sphingobium sp. TaxID=1912891 RepID=UPI0029A16A35|nr:FAD-linked oxidase C-terminal domain-containing protein [Sphingobium sp.]MDX3910318.1 FAD-linked oxidase C-terminal domain-containing protein [Sphingobium sp.]
MTAPAEAARRPLPTGFVDDLRLLFGDRLQLGDAVRLQHGSSETHFSPVLPDAVVFAHSTEEVVALVKLCTAAKVPIIPYGAGTSIEGNTTPVGGGVTVDLSEMNAIVEVNVEDLDCTVQAGVRREQLNEYLRDCGLFFPIDPGANATIGGMASTRASGTNAVRYGTMRDAILRLRVVTPDGRDIWTSRRARKSAAGYDLTRLMIGSEGTLGIITEVTLRLHGIPEEILSAVCSFETLAGAVETVVQAIQLGVPLARVEILDDVQMKAVNRWAKLDYPELTTLFFEFHGSKRYVQEQVEAVGELARSNGGGAFRWSNLPEERSKLWRARHEAYYAAVGLRAGAVGWPTDVCVPISRLAQCINETKKDLEDASIPAPILGHVGDGNFHVIFVIDPDRPEEAAEAERLNGRLIERALAMDGTCTGEHGIGLGKQDWLLAELGQSVSVMRCIKQALDPLNLFNPGKIFPFEGPVI